MLNDGLIVPIPTVFFSYSWDAPEHQRWVRDLAARLRADGVDTVLDQWHAVPGDQLPVFMEKSVRESQFVLVICTPKYKLKSDRRYGGVGYEGDIMTAEVFTGAQRRKFIPVLHTGSWQEAAPSWLLASYYIDLRGEPYSEDRYRDLLDVVHGRREQAPPIGAPPPINGLPAAFDEHQTRHFLIARRGERRSVWPANCVFVKLPSDNIVAFKQLEYPTFQGLLDDLYVHYLHTNFGPANYGKSWVLAGRSTARVAVPLSWLLRSTALPLRDAERGWATSPPALFGVLCALSLREKALQRMASGNWFINDDVVQRGSFWEVREADQNQCFGVATNDEAVFEEFFWGLTHSLKTLPHLLDHYNMRFKASGSIVPGASKYEAVFFKTLFALFGLEIDDIGGKILVDRNV